MDPPTFSDLPSRWFLPLTKQEMENSKEILALLKHESFQTLAVAIQPFFANRNISVIVSQLLKASADSADFNGIQTTWRLTFALLQEQNGRPALLTEIDQITRMIGLFSLAAINLSECTWIQKVAFSMSVMNSLITPAVQGTAKF